jgi:hypothetical protein
MALPADELREVEIQARPISEAEGAPCGEVLDDLLGVL